MRTDISPGTDVFDTDTPTVAPHREFTLLRTRINDLRTQHQTAQSMDADQRLHVLRMVAKHGIKPSIARSSAPIDNIVAQGVARVLGSDSHDVVQSDNVVALPTGLLSIAIRAGKEVREEDLANAQAARKPNAAWFREQLNRVLHDIDAELEAAQEMSSSLDLSHSMGLEVTTSNPND